MRLTCLTCILLILAGALPLAAARADDAEANPTERFSGEFDLVLRDALARREQQPDQAANLHLYLTCRDGQWQTAWGKGMTIAEHIGLIDEAEVSDDRIRLQMSMLVLGDFWVKGQWPLSLSLDLDRGEAGALAGTFTGWFDGRRTSGRIEGTLLPAREAPEGFEPPGQDEHPRLLFRRSDIPRLKQKLQTPFGQAYKRAAGSSDPINLGVLYQLTGEKAYADRAMRSIQGRYKDDIPVFGFGSGGFGHDIFLVAVAYDLCNQAWPDQFNRWIVSQLEAFTERHQHILMTSHANFHPSSNYYGPGRGVPGVVSMVLWGDRGKLDRPPRDPVAAARPIQPPRNFQPGKGVSVNELAFGKLPTQGWIWTGPLPYECSRDVLNDIGGYVDARPQIGTTALYTIRTEKWFKQVPLTFKALPAEAVSEDGIDVAKAAGEAGAHVAAYFTALRVNEETNVALNCEARNARVFVSGIELSEEAYFRLMPGVHTLLIEHRSRQASGTLAPTFSPPGDSATDTITSLFRIQRKLWERDQALWEQTGMDPVRRLWLERAWWQNMQHYRWGIGDGGFKAETGGYANISSWYPSVYASMYPNFHGRQVSPYPDVSHIMPRQMMQAIFTSSGRVQIDKLNSALSLDTQWMACHFPIIPEQYQPYALWAWNVLAGADADRPAAVFSAGRHAPRDITLAQTFVNYPLDIKPKHPTEGMPLHWRADTFGFYVLRSGWESDSDFVAQMFLKASPVGGWNHPNAGGFQIRGLGHTWTDAPESRNGVREQYSVVLLPEDKINEGSCARLTHFDTRPDGSGSLTMDMRDVYAAPSRRLHTGYFIREESRFQPSGITGLRAVALDYSGRSGAPALMVMVDKVEGGGKKIWTWQKTSQKVSVHENGFTLSHPGASMKATFVTPGKIEIEHGVEQIQVREPRHGYHGPVNRVKVTGGDSYFVILTFQKGEAPDVTVEGSGLDAKVKVGNQHVRFDGDRILIGPQPE